MNEFNDWLNDLPWYVLSLVSALFGAAGSLTIIRIRKSFTSKSEGKQEHRDHGQSSNVSFHVEGDLNLITGSESADKNVAPADDAIVAELLRRFQSEDGEQ